MNRGRHPDVVPRVDLFRNRAPSSEYCIYGRFSRRGWPRRDRLRARPAIGRPEISSLRNRHWPVVGKPGDRRRCWAFHGDRRKRSVYMSVLW